MPTKLSIVEQIELWQKRRGVSNQDMAALLGITAQNYLRRKRLNTFTSAELEIIAEHLSLSVELISN